MPEVYDYETVGESFTKAGLNGNWDVLIFDGSSPKPDYNSVVRYTSQKVSLLGDFAITEKMIEKGSKLDGSSFKKDSPTNYRIVLDGVDYQVFPTLVWDNELDSEVIVLTGFGSDGSTLWAKKAFSPYMGIYLETFDYLLDIADSSVSRKYKKKLDRISSDPSQQKIDSYCRALAGEILKSYEK